MCAGTLVDKIEFHFTTECYENVSKTEHCFTHISILSFDFFMLFAQRSLRRWN